MSGDIWSGVQSVSKQDYIAPWNDFYFVQSNGAPTVLTVAVPDPFVTPTRLLTVDSVANISIGDFVGVFTGAGGVERYYWSLVIDINGLVLTMSTLIDYPFGIGSVVLSTVKNMAVDGSITPQVFSIQSGGTTGTLAIDVTRILMAMLTDSAVSLSEFGDIPELEKGIYLRIREELSYRNKLVARSNLDLAKFAYDWTPYQSINPAQGQDGLNWRFSLNGDDKHGAVSRISGGNIGTIEWVIQDDLTAINTIESVGANHEVTL